MFVIICLIIIIYIYHSSAKRANKNVFVWISIGFSIWLVLGFVMLIISDNIILHQDSLAEAVSSGGEKLLLEGISSVIILIAAYFVQDKLLKKN